MAHSFGRFVVPRRRFAAALHMIALGSALATSSVAGCGGGRSGAATEGPRGSSVVGGTVVSTVDGHPITIAQVEQVVAAGLPPREALTRLQGERLLMTDAARRGFGRLDSVAMIAEQARVQALLEAEAAAVTVSDEEIRAAYEKQIKRFEQPERRASVHVLARLPKDAPPELDAAARDYADRMLGQLALATDVKDFLARHNRQRTPQFQITAEAIPPAERESKALVAPYLEALFSIPGPGVVATPVRTEFGWHAIRVIDVLPSESTPYEQAANALRSELLLAKRKERVQKLVEQLRRTYRVEIAPDVEQTLAKLSL